MGNPISQHQFIVLGRRLWYLEALAPDAPIDNLVVVIGQFRESLTQCGAVNTLAASEPLTRLQIPYSRLTQQPTSTAVSQVRLMLTPIREALQHETANKLMIELRTGDVTARLRELPQSLQLNEAQKLLLEETCRCVEVGVYRAANVMAWSLAYDYIRQWLYDTKLPEFNSSLTHEYQANHPNPIVEYQEFFTRKALGEYVVLDTMNDAGIIDGRLFDKLVHYLRERNTYAHPNFTQPSVSKTNAYIENLIDIIEGPPFTCNEAGGLLKTDRLLSNRRHFQKSRFVAIR